MKASIIIIILTLLACAALAASWWLFYYLWNVIIAAVFGAPSLTYWQAAGICILIGFITGGLRASKQ